MTYVDGSVIRRRMAEKSERVNKGITARLRAARKRHQETAARYIYDAVTTRDEGRCRACGVYAGTAAHRHHLIGRTSTTLQTVCLVCPECHEKLHVRVGGKTLRMWGDAEVRSPYGTPCGLTVERLVPEHGWVRWCDR